VIGLGEIWVIVDTFAPSATPLAQAGSCGCRASPVTLSFARRTFVSVATAQLFSSREDCRARPRSRRHAPERGRLESSRSGEPGSRPRDRLQVEARGRSASSPLPSGARRSTPGREVPGPPRRCQHGIYGPSPRRYHRRYHPCRSRSAARRGLSPPRLEPHGLPAWYLRAGMVSIWYLQLRPSCAAQLVSSCL
jgi:hypothetical protein